MTATNHDGHKIDHDGHSNDGHKPWRPQTMTMTTTTMMATNQSLVTALVLSRLDYGNGTLVGLPAYLIRRLQSVQNAVARLIFRLRRSDHITDALTSLHWLRVP